MKLRHIFVATVVAFLSLMDVSCKKEANENFALRSFTGVIDQNTKTHLDDGVRNDGEGWLGVVWDLTDEVLVSVADNGEFRGKKHIYTISSINADNVATFHASGNTYNNTYDDQNSIKGSKFCLLYPANAALVNADGSMMLNIPKEQRYAENSMIGAPMYSEYSTSSPTNSIYGNNNSAETTTLKFKNLCSQLRLNLQGNYTIKAIVVKCTDNGKYLSGNFGIYEAEEGPENGRVTVWEARTETMPPTKGMSKSIVMNCGNGVDISTAKDFNIYMPVGYYNVSITIFAIDGCSTEIHSNTPINFTRDHLKKVAKTISFEHQEPGSDFTHDGIFAVSTTDHVYISPTNLMNTAGPNTYYDESWSYGEHPYDMLGQYTQGQNYWNRFSWSTNDANDNFGMMVSGHEQQNRFRGDFLDWGVNEQSRPGQAMPYPSMYGFTLTKDQWEYMLGLNGSDRVSVHMEPDSKCYGYCYILPEAGYTFYAGDANGQNLKWWTRYHFVTGDTPSNSSPTGGPSTEELNYNGTPRIIYELYRNGDPGQGVDTVLEKGLYDCRVKVDGNNWFSGIPCLVIYPDNMPVSKQLKRCEYFHANKSYAISDARYQELRQYGCAFLPLVGQGQGAAGQTSSKMVFLRGFYWSSTPNGSDAAYQVVLTWGNNDISATVASNSRGNGCCVRLASHAPADSRHNTSSAKKH